jgi:2-amino-4-hydroxy-6-hydroxymethyldihydropteridine diphosphokinase
MIPKSGHRFSEKTMREKDVREDISPAKTHEVLIGLGGNVGNARATLDRAVAMFCDGREVTLIARSSDYRTPPWGLEDQPPFVNLCLIVATALSPPALLRRAQQVESALGRDRANERRWGPRAVDIDLLAYDDLNLDEPDLVLPHPRLLERAFVLVPLAEIAPQRVIAGIKVREALARVDAGGIEKLPPRNSMQA